MNDNGHPPGDNRERRPSLLDGLLHWLPGRKRGEASVRDSLDEIIEEREDAETPLGDEERRLLANILSLRDRTVWDVMVPRANIIAVPVDATLDEVIAVMTREGHSRIPIYRGTLDDIAGMVHIKDLLPLRNAADPFTLDKVKRETLFVVRSMRVLELLLEMRVTKSHLALVVDEYGGTDGLVTIEDLVEEIVGEIDDEHDDDDDLQLHPRDDGAYDADARVALEDLEALSGPLVSADEREDVDTLAGLVFLLAGRVPNRGELVRHPSGVEFEVVDADPRRIRRLRIRLPAKADDAGDE